MDKYLRTVITALFVFEKKKNKETKKRKHKCPPKESSGKLNIATIGTMKFYVTIQQGCHEILLFKVVK